MIRVVRPVHTSNVIVLNNKDTIATLTCVVDDDDEKCQGEKRMGDAEMSPWSPHGHLSTARGCSRPL